MFENTCNLFFRNIFFLKSHIICFVCVLTSHYYLFAQNVEKGTSYSIPQLSQEQINIIGEPRVTNFAEEADTSYTIYGNSSVKFRTYFVNGAEYDNIFNPNPTGIYLNGQHFVYYCGVEMTIRQNYNNILEVKEFSFLGKNYLMIMNFREDCHGEGCRYRCYNLFDISKPERISQVSFSSVFESSATFGEFNSDGVIDFLRVAPKPDKDRNNEDGSENFLITAYTIPRKTAKQLTNKEKHAYYLYVNGDPEVKNFKVLQADWFFTMKDTSGNIAPATSYFAPYISFDPLYKYLYTPAGVRIEKNRWSVYTTYFGDLEAAQEYCRKLISKKLGDPYIMIDQYSNEIKYQVFVGNYVSKNGAQQSLKILEKNEISAKLRDLRKQY